MLKRTPLFAAHQKAGGKLIEFGGWEMPVQYSSIVDEHLCVRRAAGIFDISHMGEMKVSGHEAAGFLNATLTNDINKLLAGQGQYTLMCNERGGVIDDLYAYRLGETEYLLIINASRIEPDTVWLEARLAEFPQRAGVKLENVSDATAAVAVQGPRVVEFIDQCFPGASQAGTQVARVTELKKNQIGRWQFQGQAVWIGRTGYTGEDGFEIVAPAGIIEALWNHVLALGHVGCLQPCGLGARDTLRTEVCYPLYGHELDETTTPIEAGLGFFVALDKGEFTGRAALAEQKANGVSKRCVAFKMTDRSAPPRPHYPIWADGEKVGEVVSGTQSPSLNVGIGMGYVPPQFAEVGTKIEIEIRGRRFAAETVKKPIYRKPA
ncbi:MAG TPA: glycine cleavage system aminomethyltransferase GcvT [Verrucomicrobiae bacterium]|jgi:aminomethyltransferase